MSVIIKYLWKVRLTDQRQEAVEQTELLPRFRDISSRQKDCYCRGNTAALDATFTVEKQGTLCRVEKMHEPLERSTGWHEDAQPYEVKLHSLDIGDLMLALGPGRFPIVCSQVDD
jgi:hypothetical protein